MTITTMRSGVVRVEDAEESLYASIDLVADKIARKLKKVRATCSEGCRAGLPPTCVGGPGGCVRACVCVCVCHLVADTAPSQVGSCVCTDWLLCACVAPEEGRF